MHQLQRQRPLPQHHHAAGAKRAKRVVAAGAAPSAAPAAAEGLVSWSQTSNGSWVCSPRYASARRPPGVVHLLGGAFAGAAPQVAYARLAEALAAPPRRSGSSGGGSSGGGGGGFTVVATPYRLTFDHLGSAERVRRDLLEAVEEIAAGGGDGGGDGAPPPPSSSPLAGPTAQRACAAVLAGRAPLLAIGHSNGALLHALGACQQQQQLEEEGASYLSDAPPPGRALLRPRAAALLCYNNKAVGDAVPFGLLDRLRDALPPPPPPAPSSSSSGGEQQQQQDGRLPTPAPLLAGAEALLLPLVPPRVARASPAVEQVATVADEVRRGASDFSPPPARTREIVARSYPRALRTLLVRFSDDATDETPELARMLAGRPRVAPVVVLPGTHLTPCGLDDALLRPPAASARSPPTVRPFTPVDALAMAAREWGRADRERDADRLADRIVAFFRAAAAAAEDEGDAAATG